MYVHIYVYIYIYINMYIYIHRGSRTPSAPSSSRPTASCTSGSPGLLLHLVMNRYNHLTTCFYDMFICIYVYYS